MGLLAKLHYGVAELLDEATVVSYTATRECKTISSRFMVCIDVLTVPPWMCMYLFGVKSISLGFFNHD